MPNMKKRLIGVVSAQVGDDPSQAIIRGWEYLPKESEVTGRYSALLGASGLTRGNPREITTTLNGNSHPFFRVANVAWGGRGDGGEARHWRARRDPHLALDEGDQKHLPHRGGPVGCFFLEVTYLGGKCTLSPPGQAGRS